MKDIVLPANYKRSAVKAILAVLLFLLVYTFIVLLAAALTICCGYSGITLITATFSAPTLIGGIGLIGFSLLLLIFTIKFLFKKYVADRSHLLEITIAQQPELFALIAEVNRKTGTTFPKKVFLSSEVNASVFYDSDIRSMVLPTQKHLNIGVGLLNVVNRSEFKAILAHEFGHFSQRSMAIGSYVYKVNRIIYNMLSDDRGYSELIRRWSAINNSFSLLAHTAVRVIRGIRWVWQKVYLILNTQYSGLSRAMEFHADEVAAHAVGSEPLMTSLQRLDLANFSLEAVLQFYNNHAAHNLYADDIYAQQHFVMLFQAEQAGIPLRNGLPHLSHEHLTRFNKSKLTVHNQWASHPETGERIAHIRRLNVASAHYDPAPAISLLRQAAAIRTKFTLEFFGKSMPEMPMAPMSLQAFKDAYTAVFYRSGFDSIYHGFYDHRNPGFFDTAIAYTYPEDWKNRRPDELFTAELTELACTSRGLAADMAALGQIAAGTVNVKSFDYDGIKYTVKQSRHLIIRLKDELDTQTELLRYKDTELYAYFYEQADSLERKTALQQHYDKLFYMDREYEGLKSAYETAVRCTRFVQAAHRCSDILGFLACLADAEKTLKVKISMLLSEPAYDNAITPEMRADLHNYLEATGPYFAGNRYHDGQLHILFTALEHFGTITTNSYFFCKKSLLTFQKELCYPAGNPDKKEHIASHDTV